MPDLNYILCPFSRISIQVPVLNPNLLYFEFLVFYLVLQCSYVVLSVSKEGFVVSFPSSVANWMNTIDAYRKSNIEANYCGKKMYKWLDETIVTEMSAIPVETIYRLWESGVASRWRWSVVWNTPRLKWWLEVVCVCTVCATGQCDMRLQPKNIGHRFHVIRCLFDKV